MMHCPNCGHTAQPGLARCGHCNFKLPESALPAATPQTSVQICWNCTHPNASHAIYCAHCNAKQEQAPKRQTAPRRAPVTPNTLSHDE